MADLRRLIKNYRHAIGEVRRGRRPIFIEYPYDMRARWTEGDGNPHLAALIGARNAVYRANLAQVAALKPNIEKLKNGELPFSIDWRNIWLPALDGFTVMWAALKANTTYMEVGSGNSTMFARAALLTSGRNTKIVSIDPQPRAEIDKLCDEVIRAPLESVDLEVFDRLEPGDALFIDNSHQSFMNSDVTVFMLDVLPRLKPGVLVGLHDIFLPWDYPADWVGRGYNEQYLLASWLLAGGQSLDLQLANYWISRKGMQLETMPEIWRLFDRDIAERGASAIWAYKR